MITRDLLFFRKGGIPPYLTEWCVHGIQQMDVFVLYVLSPRVARLKKIHIMCHLSVTDFHFADVCSQLITVYV